MRRISTRELEQRLERLAGLDRDYVDHLDAHARMSPETRGLPPRPTRLVLHLWDGELFVNDAGVDD